MAQNTDIVLNSAGWTELTNADAASIRVENIGSVDVKLQATSGSAPSDALGSIVLPVRQMLVNEALADLWPGLSGATRVFAIGAGFNAKVSVSHA